MAYYLCKITGDIPQYPGFEYIRPFAEWATCRIESPASEIMDFAKIKAIPLDESVAIVGTKWFAVHRGYVKSPSVDPDWKKTVENITPEIEAKTVTLMYIVACAIVDDIFDARYNMLSSLDSDLEMGTWAKQLEEAKAYQENPNAGTPTLDAISIKRNIPKVVLVPAVISAAEDHNAAVVDLMLEAKSIKDEFKSKTTIPDMNILYEKYLGFQIPTKQAMELGLCDETGNRIDKKVFKRTI